jgi:uncharacterized protein
MSYSKFKILRTGEYFYYNNQLNAVYDQDGNILSLPCDIDPELLKEWQDVNGVDYKSTTPISLRITLGHGCNYDCSYCMQKDIGNPDERPQNKNLGNLINQIRDNLDLSKLERIELWGGEPFLYWKDMEQLMSEFDKEGLVWYISTNGSALQQKHVDFFKSLSSTVTMGISHDGHLQEVLRGLNPLEKRASVIKQFDDMWPKFQYSFNPVISKTNYNLFSINKYFKKYVDKYNLKHASISWTLGRVYDETNTKNSADHVITGEHVAKFKTILNDYLTKSAEQHALYGVAHDKELLPSIWFNGGRGVLKYAASVHKQMPITITSNCGADASDIISFDLDGNIRLCPHTKTDYATGHLSDIANSDINKLDLDRKSSHCYHCPNLRLCKSSCPIKVDDEVFNINCRVEKALYGTIQQKAFEMLFQSPVELEDWGLNTISTQAQHA